jgi:hypothetical protein
MIWECCCELQGETLGRGYICPGKGLVTSPLGIKPNFCENEFSDRRPLNHFFLKNVSPIQVDFRKRQMLTGGGYLQGDFYLELKKLIPSHPPGNHMVILGSHSGDGIYLSTRSFMRFYEGLFHPQISYTNSYESGREMLTAPADDSEDIIEDDDTLPETQPMLLPDENLFSEPEDSSPTPQNIRSRQKEDTLSGFLNLLWKTIKKHKSQCLFKKVGNDCKECNLSLVDVLKIGELHSHDRWHKIFEDEADPAEIMTAEEFVASNWKTVSGKEFHVFFYSLFFERKNSCLKQNPKIILGSGEASTAKLQTPLQRVELKSERQKMAGMVAAVVSHRDGMTKAAGNFKRKSSTIE